LKLNLCVFTACPSGSRQKIMLLPLSGHSFQHRRIPTRVADARNKPLFHQKQAGARRECTICVFCELYFLSCLMLIFLQIHQICSTEKATDFCTKLPSLWVHIMTLCPWKEFLDCVLSSVGISIRTRRLNLQKQSRAVQHMLLII